MSVTAPDRKKKTTTKAFKVPTRRPSKSATASIGVTSKQSIDRPGLGAEPGDLLAFLRLSPLDQARVTRTGMQATILLNIATHTLHIPMSQLLAALRLPESTIHRKLAKNEQLASSEADRVARVLLVHARAEDVLEDAGLAAQWLNKPHPELRDETPLSMLDTQSGYDRVRELLLRLEYGVPV